MLTVDQKIRFFAKALDRCEREKMFGYAAGAFMLGRFISTPLPVAFWRSFGPSKTALLLNEGCLRSYMPCCNGRENQPRPEAHPRRRAA
jgi:hypothetical protein